MNLSPSKKPTKRCSFTIPECILINLQDWKFWEWAYELCSYRFQSWTFTVRINGKVTIGMICCQIWLLLFCEHRWEFLLMRSNRAWHFFKGYYSRFQSTHHMCILWYGRYQYWWIILSLFIIHKAIVFNRFSELKPISNMF